MNGSQFKVEITKDGSPSLRFYQVDGERSELMHHSEGAATETIYIYGDAITKALKLWAETQSINYLVVGLGLGLGYIESLIYILSDSAPKKVISFEKNAQLKIDFMNWIDDSKDQNGIYDQMLKSLIVSSKLKSTFEIIKERLKISLEEQKLILGPALNMQTSNNSGNKFNVICYDAFSSHTDQDLWSEEFLIHFLDQFAAPKCVFATYAATSALKRALKSAGFKIQPKEGFSGKRESTLAIRES